MSGHYPGEEWAWAAGVVGAWAQTTEVAEAEVGKELEGVGAGFHLFPLPLPLSGKVWKGWGCPHVRNRFLWQEVQKVLSSYPKLSRSCSSYCSLSILVLLAEELIRLGLVQDTYQSWADDKADGAQ